MNSHVRIRSVSECANTRMYIVPCRTGPPLTRLTLRRTPAFIRGADSPGSDDGKRGECNIQQCRRCSLLLDFSVSSDMQPLCRRGGGKREDLLLPIPTFLSLPWRASVFRRAQSLFHQLLWIFTSRVFLIPSPCHAILYFAFVVPMVTKTGAAWRPFTVYEAPATAYGVAIIVNCRRSVKERSPFHKFRTADTDPRSNFYSR